MSILKTVAMKSKIYLALLFIVVLISCNKEKEVLKDSGGQLQLAFQERINELKSAGIVSTTDSIYAAVISIESQQGEKVFNMKTVELLNMNGHYISAPISLNAGNYKLTDFLLKDKNNRILYACPKEGSNQAKLVDHPLDIMFNINKDEVTNLAPEVLKVTIPEDFGYVSFGFQVIKSFDFLMGVFIYDENAKSFVLTNATLTVSDGADFTQFVNLESVTNNITTRDNILNYSLKVEKQGYQTYKKTLSSTEIKQYTEDGNGPLIVILNKMDSNVTDKWFNTYGTPEHDYAYAVCPTKDGSYIACGTYNNFNTGASNLYMVKTDANGSIIWEKRYSEFAEGKAIKLLENGNYIVFGHNRDGNLCLLEVDDQGNTVWSKSYIWGYSRTKCLAICADGGFIISGISYTSNNEEIVVIKTDNKGNEEWRRIINGDYNYRPSGIVQVSGGYLVTGEKRIRSLSYFQAQICLIKLNDEGQLVWNKSYGTTSSIHYAIDILHTQQNHIYILGTDGFGGNTSHPKMLLKKVDQDGNEIWTKLYDSNLLPTHRGIQATSMTETLDGNIYLLGNTNNEEDILVIKIDQSGNELKKNYFGVTNYFVGPNYIMYSGNDWGNQVIATADNGCIVTGFTNAFSGKNPDMFLLKLDSELQGHYSFNAEEYVVLTAN